MVGPDLKCWILDPSGWPNKLIWWAALSHGGLQSQVVDLQVKVVDLDIR